ncbi:glucokinase [Rubrivivax gelatinosus]|uniref:Glucokinase n=2 Tax=Rubrivivax gelatinosus TaxID=28068 RepID=I0HKR4_RUBGI|nr:glucokinase [Rubrivivax gelatinosus]MBG6080225.1 glucokinase [Rubrivivax gelatinosus]BAL93601.1 glucokinase Glk [Rubrivivax gelatinosus IL144]
MNLGGSAVPRPWLVADIGGTNARFALVDGAGAPPRDIHRVRCADYAGPVEAARAYLAERQAAAGTGWQAPDWAAFAVATPVGQDRIELTNSAWSFSRAESEAALGLDGLLMLNDFEALALSLPGLAPQQLRAHGALPAARGTLAVLGPGTGLGVGGLLETAHGWRAIAGEGGHATLAAGDDFEAEVLRVVRGEFEHVSAERLLSGIGLPTLYRAIARVRGEAAAELTAEEIGTRGADGSDALCAATLDSFCAMLGGFAGNVALTFGARGGVFIGGGIVPRFADFFFASRFRERFEAKGRFRAYLEAVPTALIVEPYAALYGAAAAIEARRRRATSQGHAA